jgi:hypothetical protein
VELNDWQYKKTYTPVLGADLSPTDTEGWEVASAGLVEHNNDGLCLLVEWRKRRGGSSITKGPPVHWCGGAT